MHQSTHGNNRRREKGVLNKVIMFQGAGCADPLARRQCQHSGQKIQSSHLWTYSGTHCDSGGGSKDGLQWMGWSEGKSLDKVQGILVGDQPDIVLARPAQRGRDQLQLVSNWKVSWFHYYSHYTTTTRVVVIIGGNVPSRPAKRGLLSRSSANTHPIAQISTTHAHVNSDNDNDNDNDNHHPVQNQHVPFSS